MGIFLARAKSARGLPRSLPAALLLVLLALAGAPRQAEAAPQLSWSQPSAFDSGRTPSALSCASESLCVAVDKQGYALSSSDPGASPANWIEEPIDTGEGPLNAVSCASTALCVAVDAHGNAFLSTAPASGGWGPKVHIKGAEALTGVSCPSASLCVAAGSSGKLWSTSTPQSSEWSEANFGSAHKWRSVSCAPTDVCAAVDEAGELVTSSDPAGGRSQWHEQSLDTDTLIAVSCAAPSASASMCVAVDAAGRLYASDDPGSASPSWAYTQVGGSELTGASCAGSGMCVAVSASGEAYASDDATSLPPQWPGAPVDSGVSLSGVSCLAGGFCLAVDSEGRSLSGRVPAPAVTTEKPSEVTSVSAVLTGVVNPNDAVLGACTFEYGRSVPYEGSVPCALVPAPLAGPQEVSADVGGLSPNTTYHFRITAASPAGAAAGADEAFTTAVSSAIALVRPNPTLSGTPAVGQTLTCHANLPAGAVAQVSYGWLRDQVPIVGASASSYQVKGQDSGHHLQCEVTASDGGGSVTVKSAFVTIPAGGAPVSAGETAVGKASVKGIKVGVPVTCSSKASGGCSVAVSVKVVETLEGARVLALAARAPRGAHARGAGVRHETVTIASARAHISGGAHATLLATLGESARRLLAAHGRFSAYVYVTGTVIGVIQAQLAQQRVTFSAPTHSAPTHAQRR